jgi:NADH-quinone oxidoreductase subunit H
VLLVLLSVAFFTLFERKIMGLVHIRLGPNKVAYLGLLQPLLDAFKLLSKSLTITSYSNKFIYFISPYISLGLSLVLWSSIPSFYTFTTGSFSFLVFVLVCSVIVFFVLIRGWSSNSKYSFIGCMRSIAQSISYEAVFSTLLILVLIFYMTYRISSSYTM